MMRSSLDLLAGMIAGGDGVFFCLAERREKCWDYMIESLSETN